MAVSRKERRQQRQHRAECRADRKPRSAYQRMRHKGWDIREDIPLREEAGEVVVQSYSSLAEDWTTVAVDDRMRLLQEVNDLGEMDCSNLLVH